MDKALKVLSVLVLTGMTAGLLVFNVFAMPQGHAVVANAASGVLGPGARAAKDQPLPEVSGISITPTTEGSAVIKINTTRQVPYRVMHLSNPPRLVVDFEGARLGVRRRIYPAESGVLNRVRVGQWQSQPSAVARVVADLTGSPGYDIQRQAWGVQVELKPRGAESRRQSDPTPRPKLNPKPNPKPAPNPFVYRSRGKDVRRSESAAGKPRWPSAEFGVHQFADLTASLTKPELPRHDRLVPVLKDQPVDGTGANSEQLALVSGVTVKPDENGETLVDIASSQSVPYRVFQLADPLRLVIDLKGARNTSGRDVYRVGSPVLRQVRMGQWRSEEPSVVRVVADLEGSPFFDVHAQQPGIRVELKPRRELGPLIRNPFEFTRQSPSVRISHPSDAAPYLPLARTAPASAPGAIVFSDLKVLGYLEKPGTGTQAIVSDNMHIYFVAEGGVFEERFQLLKIMGKAVEIQDLTTKQTAWVPFAP